MLSIKYFSRAAMRVQISRGPTRKHLWWMLMFFAGGMCLVFVLWYNPMSLPEMIYTDKIKTTSETKKRSTLVDPSNGLTIDNPVNIVNIHNERDSSAAHLERRAIDELNQSLGSLSANKFQNSETTYGEFETYNSELTLVTAFLDIGPFPKGSMGNVRTSQTYLNWMNVYQSVDNPIVMYTDSKHVYNRFQKLRQCFPENRTKIHLINRNDLWVFSLRARIMEVFRQPNYPIHYPNTYNENYTCMTHSKFEVLQRTAKENPFKTKYFAWVDIGLYRNHNITELFHVTLPPKFNESKVSVFNVFPFVERPVQGIIKGNINWIGGGMFIGTRDSILTFTEDYLKAVRILLKHNLMNVEQHILYAMYTNGFYFKPRTELQVYNKGWLGDPWFLLAEITRVLGLAGNSTFIRECH